MRRGKGVRGLAVLLAFQSMFSLASRAAETDWETWNSLMAEASRLSMQGEFRAALPVAMRAVELARRAGEGEGRLADSLDGLGFLLSQTGDYTQAENALLQSLAISKRLPGSQQRMAITLDHMGILYQQTRGHTAEVEALRRKALDIAMAGYGPDAPEIGMLLSRLASSLIRRGKFDEAEAKLQRALQLTDEQRLPALAADIYINLGAVAYHKRRYAAALEAYDRAGQLYGQVAGPSGAGRVPQLTGKASVYLKTRRAPEADKALEEAEKIASHVWGSRHRIVGEILLFRLQALKKLGKRTELRQVEVRARAIFAAHQAEVSNVNSRVDASFLER